MKRNEIIKAYCELSTKIMKEKFNYKIPADCFCENYDQDNFQFDQSIVDFVIAAVDEKIKREK